MTVPQIYKRVFAENQAYSEVLMYGKISVVPAATCSQLGDAFYQRVQHDNSMMCAVGERRDTCRGDSGGPLVAETRNGLVQYGITSFGYVMCDSFLSLDDLFSSGQGCSIDDTPGVYSYVPSSINWIRSIVTLPGTDRMLPQPYRPLAKQYCSTLQNNAGQF